MSWTPATSVLLSARHSGRPRVQAREPSEPRICPIFPCLFHSEGHHPPEGGQGYSQQRFVSRSTVSQGRNLHWASFLWLLLHAATQMSTSEMSERPLYEDAAPPVHPQPRCLQLSSKRGHVLPECPQSFLLTLNRTAPSPAEI